MLRIFIERALADEPLRYHGSGGRRQDFAHADDIALAMRAAIERRADGTFDIATGEPITMRELAKLVVSSIPGCTSPIVASGQPDPQECATALFGTERAAAVLDWRAQIPLAVGIADWVNRLREGDPS